MYTIKSAISVFAYVLNILILIRCIISWLPTRNNGSLMQLLFALTDPVILPIRAMIRKSPLGGSGMMIDFSPMIAMLLVNAVARLLISIL